MGIDAYFVAFAMFGIVCVPYFLYNHLTPSRNFYKDTLGITRETMPSFWE